MMRKACVFMAVILLITGFGICSTTAAYDTGLLPAPVTTPQMTIKAAPLAPSELQVDRKQEIFELTWKDNSNNETGFRIERMDESTESYTEIAVVKSNVTMYADKGPVQGTTICYRIRAYNAVGYSAYSNEAAIILPTVNSPTTPKPPAPSPAPKPLSAPSSVPAQSAQVTASPMDLGADMFLADTENLQIKKVKEIAINAAAGAPQEEEKDVTILYPAGGEVIYHGQPFIIEVKVNKSGNYVLSFTNMIYTCEFYGAEGSVYILPLNYGSNYHNDNKLQIHEKSSGTLIAESEEFTIGATPPFNAVTNAVPGDNQVSLSWQPIAAAPGRVAYDIYRGIGPFESYTQGTSIIDFPVTENSYIDRTAKNGTAYYYYIKPVIDGYDNGIGYYYPAEVKPNRTIVLTVGNPNMIVNGEPREIDPGQGTAPVIVNGRTFLPIRAVIEAMGGTVGWDGAAQKVTINNKGIILELIIGSTTAKVNGHTAELEVAPYISDTGRTMLPLRFVTESLGCDVEWEWTTKTVTIKY